MKMNRHLDTFLTFDELGTRYPEYQPTFDYGKTYIDLVHKSYSTSRLKDETIIQVKNGRWWGGSIIEGWLRRADALKLYEMAYCVKGDILELGSYHGLSTSILAQANRRSSHRKHIYSVDLDPGCVFHTERNLRSKGLLRDVTTICAEATAAVKALAAEGKQFEFVFIDHSHAYEPNHSVCKELDSVMAPGAFCLFHDFNDPRNRDAQDEDYGVYQAVINGLDSTRFEFYGVYGCTALFRKCRESS